MAGKHKHHDPIPVLEWISAGAGLLIAVALFAIIGSAALTGSEDVVPHLSAQVDGVVRAGNGHVVQVTIQNRSSRTAASVQIEGALKQGSASVETSSASIDYVPGHSQATGGLHFTRDPRAYQLELRVIGHELP
jgi:uncharacterized protein (TIGR02588 family)